jgi:hypothetical protein
VSVTPSKDEQTETKVEAKGARRAHLRTVTGCAAEPAEERVSLRGFARSQGVSLTAVRKAIKAERLKESIRTDAKGRPYIWSPSVAEAEWTQNRRRTSPVAAGPPSLLTVGSLAEAQRLATIERARKLRMENDLTEGRLVDVGETSREAFESARIIRESLLNIPARLAAEIAAEPDATKVHIRLEVALREALNSTANTLKAQGE